MTNQSIQPRTLIYLAIPAIDSVLTEKNLYVSHTRLFTLFLSFYISCVSIGRQQKEEKNLIAGSMNTSSSNKKIYSNIHGYGPGDMKVKIYDSSNFFSHAQENIFFPVSFWSQSWLIYVYNLFKIRMDPWMELVYTRESAL